MRTIFERGAAEAADGIFPPCDVPAKGAAAWLGADLVRSKPPRIPDTSETTVVRHYTRLCKLNYGVDDGIYPLGSCTMK